MLAADGSRLGFIQASELRLPAEGDEFPKVLKDATVAIEDRRFYQHEGIDYEGIVRAGVQNLVNQKTVQGGSTITMQLARNLYISSERTYERKIREAKVAEEIENEHSKEWILDKYLNTVPYGTVGGQSAIGAKAAARIYFNKRLGQLTLREAALLAGLPQAPSLYSPLRSPGAAKARRNDVLREMARSRMITQRDGRADDAARPRARSLDLLHAPPRELLLRLRQGRADQGVRRQDRAPRRPAGAHDRRPQEAAAGARGDRRAPRRHRPLLGDRDDQPEERLHRGDGVLGRLRRVEVQPRRPGPPPARLDVQGHGADGRAARGRGPRRHALRLEARRPSSTTRPTGRSTSRPTPTPARGNISLRKATLLSDNSVYIQLALDIGPDKVKQAAWDMGIRSKLNGYPAETLGGLDRRRVAAGDGQRLRDDRLRRHPQPADRDHARDVPGRPQGAAGALEGQAHARRSRTA